MADRRQWQWISSTESSELMGFQSSPQLEELRKELDLMQGCLHRKV